MKFLVYLATFLISHSLLAQPEITFDIKEYNFGEITQGANGRIEIKYTNTGDSALIISRVSTGDGGSYAYPKSREPLLPGESSIILFQYDTKRLGPFNRHISVRSNASKQGKYTGIRVKGVVIYSPTTVSVEKNTVDIGQLAYGELATVQFTLKNTGKKALNIFSLFSDYNYPEQDILYDQLFSKDELNPSDRYKRSFDPEEVLTATIAIRNIHGNSGYFTRRLPYKYNSNDTLWLTITGTFTGGPTSDIVYENHNVLYYAHSILIKRIKYGSQGAVVQKDYFRRSCCIKSEWFDGRTGKINQVREYLDGVETKKTFFKNN